MSKTKKVFKWVGIVLLLILVIAFSLYMIYLRPYMQKVKEVTTINYDNNLTLVIGGGGNSGILNSDSLVLVVDTKMDGAAKDLYDKVKQIAGNKPILVVNTHFHPDHVGGNFLYKGQSILAGGNYTKEEWEKDAGEKSLPTEWLKYQLDVRMGNDTATILNFGRPAHTQSDMFVYLHRRKLLFSGDVVLNKQNAIILGKGDPEGFLAAFDYLQKHFDIEHVVPGHGPLGGKEVLIDFEQYFKDMKTAAQDNSRREELLAKYKDWTEIPIVMSPKATLNAFKKELKK